MAVLVLFAGLGGGSWQPEKGDMYAIRVLFSQCSTRFLQLKESAHAMTVYPTNTQLVSPVSGGEDGVISEAMAGEETFCLVVSKCQQHIIVPHNVRVFAALLKQKTWVYVTTQVFQGEGSTHPSLWLAS